MIQKSTFLLLITAFLIGSCGSDPLDVDASNISVDITYTDINDVIMNADSAELIKQHQVFKKNYTDIYAYLTGYCLSIGEVSDTAFYNSIALFRSDTTIQKLAGHIKHNFTDKTAIQDKITNGFKHLKYHLSDVNVPSKIVYINSLYRNGVFSTEDEISIGMEQYLGADNEVIQQLNAQVYYDWMKEGMEPEFMERDVITGWVETHCVEDVDGNLAENIIRWGKILYLTEAAYPDFEKHIILRYTKEDLDWANENEYPFWKYLVDENLLFGSDDQIKRNMIGDGPFTAGLPEQDGPDRMGQYLGWKMVHMYMEKNEVSVKDMVETPYNDILQDFEVE